MILKKPCGRTLSLFFILAVMFSFVDISKVFTAPHCLAFDSNDDANHTFINLQQWRRILSQGQWPMMNVYNNFGTPLVGDVITYPMSPLSITYAFLPGPKAMTLNRFIIGFTTLFLLFIFFHQRFEKTLTIGLSLCTYYAPGFLWHSAHHHFQMSLLLLTAFFLLQERFTRKMDAGTYIGICVLSIVMFLSVSLNVVLIMCLLVFGFQIYLSGGVKEKSLWLVISGLVCGLIAVLPDTLFFLQAASRSIRKLAEYPVAATNGPNKVLLSPIVAAGIYTWAVYKEKRNRDAGVIFWLGVFPFCIVLLSQAVPFLWKQIPLLGATDVVRLTWGASIFLMIGAGGLLLRWVQQDQGWRWQVFICLLAVGIDAFYMPLLPEWQKEGRLILAFIWGMALLGFSSCVLLGNGKIKDIIVAQWMASFLAGSVVVLYLYYGTVGVLGLAYPQICKISGLPAFSVEGSEKFLIQDKTHLIPVNSRVAYDFNTINGLDLRGASEGLFGAGARSTIMTNADFSVGLFNKGLVQFDNYTGDYHFSPPWRAKDLQELGISYVAQGSDDDSLLAKGWKKIGKQKWPLLYQNPLPTGVVYLKKGDDLSPLPFVVDGNGLDIRLPLQLQGTHQLVISLLGIPGWRAWIDGRETGFIEGDNKFLVLPVSGNDHLVRVRFVPFPPVLILLSLLIALIIPWVVSRVFLNQK